ASHPSLGCQDKAKWTYFGNAFFNVALRRATTLKDAFVVARSLVLKRELRQGFDPSHPQMAGGANLQPLLVARPCRQNFDLVGAAVPCKRYHNGKLAAQLLSSLMPPVRITSPQRLLSAAINAANSSGLPSGSCSPCLLKRSRTSGTSNALRVSALSQSTVARGVPAGPMSPTQAPPWSAANPTSAEVGTSGSTGFRCGDNTASAHTCPDSACSRVSATTSNIMSTCPATTSCSASAAPR